MKLLSFSLEVCIVSLILAFLCACGDDVGQIYSTHNLSHWRSLALDIFLLAAAAFNWLYIYRVKATAEFKRFEPIQNLMDSYPERRVARNLAFMLIYPFLINHVLFSATISLNCVCMGLFSLLHKPDWLVSVQHALNAGSHFVNLAMLPLLAPALLTCAVMALFETMMLNRCEVDLKRSMSNSRDYETKFESLDRLTAVSLYRKKWQEADRYSQELLRLATLH